MPTFRYNNLVIQYLMNSDGQFHALNRFRTLTNQQLHLLLLFSAASVSFQKNSFLSATNSISGKSKNAVLKHQNDYVTLHESETRLLTVVLSKQHRTKHEVLHKDLFSKYDQIRSFLRIWSHLLKKSLMQNFFFVQGNLRKKELHVFKESINSHEHQ